MDVHGPCRIWFLRDWDIPKTLNQKAMIKLLVEHGWVQGKGTKHNVKMEKPGERPITLPKHRNEDYSKDLTARILREAGVREHAEKSDKDAKEQGKEN